MNLGGRLLLSALLPVWVAAASVEAAAAANPAPTSDYSGSSGSSDSEESRPAAPVRHIGLYAIGQMTLQNFAERPEGIESRNLQAPILLGMDFSNLAAGAKTGFWADLHLGFTAYTAAPAGGLALGPSVLLADSGVLDFGLEFETNGPLNSAMNATYLGTWRWGAVAKFRMPEQGMWQAGAEARWMRIGRTDVGKFEDIATEAAHESDYQLRPWVRYLWSPIRFEAGVGIYRLGATAISSREFAWLMPSRFVFRPELAAGVQLQKAWIWTRFAAVYPSGSDDTAEYLYTVPMYFDAGSANLMARKSLAVEVRFEL